MIPVGWCEVCGQQTTLKIRTQRRGWLGIRWFGRWRWLCMPHAREQVGQ